jgi:signal transduction histidine kinase
MDQRLILADNQGIVITDSDGGLLGTQLSSAEVNNGAPIMVDGHLVGTILVTPSNLTSSSTPAGQFLSSVNRSILTSVIIASLIALILGTILSLQITAPLRKLKKAATAITGGDLSQRVNIRSRDELGELSQSFNRMAESLEQVETQRQHLMADIAHELRTPLTVIQANLEGILDGVLPMDIEQVTAIHTETLLLNRLVGDLRLLSLAEAGELKLECQETQMATLIQQVVERIQPQAIQKGIVLEAKLHDGLMKVWIDPDRITQVLNNLISNALRYTPQGGQITIQAASPEPAGILRVSVTDPGPGIDPQALPFVFDRFYRADKSRTRSSGGSGLGLAIVKQLVEAHGGQVEATSPVFQNEDQQGYGTIISFTLPVVARGKA